MCPPVSALCTSMGYLSAGHPLHKAVFRVLPDKRCLASSSSRQLCFSTQGKALYCFDWNIYSKIPVIQIRKGFGCAYKREAYSQGYCKKCKKINVSI